MAHFYFAQKRAKWLRIQLRLTVPLRVIGYPLKLGSLLS